jgi:hypothetical protein
MIVVLLLACAAWTPVAVVSSWGPVPSDQGRAGPVEVWRCRGYYQGLTPTLDAALRQAGTRALVDVTVDQRRLGPVPTPTGCIIVRAVGVE